MPDRVEWLATAVMASLNENADTIAGQVAQRAADRANADAALVVALEGPDFEAFVSEVVGVVGRALVAGRRLDGGECAAIGDAAAKVVEGGVPALVVRNALHATCAVAVDRIVTAGTTPTADVSPVQLRRLFAVVADCEFDLLVAVDSGGQADDDATRGQRIREAFLRRVLEGPVHDPAATARRAGALKLDLTPPFGLVLLVEPPGWADDPDAAPFEELVLACRRRPRKRLLPAVFVEPDPSAPEQAVLIATGHEGSDAAGVEKALAEACGDSGLLAIRASAPDLSELPAVYHQMRLAAPTLTRCAHEVGPAPTLDSLLPYRVADGIPDAWAESLVRAEIGPLMTSPRDAERVATWKLLVRERLTDVEAGERLHVASSTVRKRRNAIETLTGRPIGSESFRAQLASYLFDLWEHDLPPAGDSWWRHAGGRASSAARLDRSGISPERGSAG